MDIQFKSSLCVVSVDDVFQINIYLIVAKKNIKLIALSKIYIFIIVGMQIIGLVRKLIRKHSNLFGMPI